MWEYRFIYRDLDEIMSRNRRVALRFAELNRRGERTVVDLCRGLVAAGTMHASERELAALATNVVMIATYWMSWQRIHATRPTHDAAIDAPDDRLGHAAYQVMALIAPYMEGDARALIERLGADYLR
jgi:hypothetical protein